MGAGRKYEDFPIRRGLKQPKRVSSIKIAEPMKDNDSSINSVCDWLQLIVSDSLVLHLGKGKHFDDLPFDTGHLIGNLFGGSGGAENLSPQNWIQNRYGTFRVQERHWQGQILNGAQVWAKVIDKYG